MTPEAQQWHSHFADCERDQLHRFPLCPNPLRDLETPLLRSQYEIALAFFQKTFRLDIIRVANERQKQKYGDSRFIPPTKATAFRADKATREAFYEHFALEPLGDYFCLRTEDWDDVFAIETQQWGWEDRYSTNWHEFMAVPNLQPHQLRNFSNNPLPQLPHESLFLREWGDLFHPMGGSGGSDVWHWNGEQLIPLPKYDSMWMC